MFWIMMYMILFNGSVTHELYFIPEERAILETVSDEGRLPAILSIRGEMASQEEALLSSMKQNYRLLVAISKDHSADNEQFNAVFANMDQDRNKIQSTLLQNRFRMKEQMTREEWKAVFKKK